MNWARLIANFARLSFAAALSLCACASVGARAQATLQTQPADVELGVGSDAYAVPVARVVSSVVEYSRWPREWQTLRLCMVGQVDHAELLDARPLSRGRSIRLVPLRTVATAATGCDAIYIGQLPIDEQRALTSAVMGAAVLTFAEDDSTCRSRAMVCLQFQADGLSFQINLDSVSRSLVRIDPRVLRMGNARRQP